MASSESSYGYPSSVISQMDSFRKAGTFCDITLNIGTGSFSAHKLVLSSASEYFQTMFTSGFKESTSSEISIEGEANIFNALLQFAYSGDLAISQDTVIAVISMASYMQFKEALILCQSYLKKAFKKKTIGFDDAYDIGILAKEQNLPELANLAWKYLAKNFLDYAETNKFVEDETADFILKCLGKEDLVSPQSDWTENDVLGAVTKWLKHNWDQRKQHAANILRKVRLGLVGVPGLKECIDTQIQEIPQCKKMLEDVLKLRADKEDDQDLLAASLVQKHPNLFATRSTISALISIGGTEPNSTSCYYNTKQKDWDYFSLSILPHSTHFHQSLIVIDGILYSVGGKAGDEDDQSVYFGDDYDNDDGGCRPTGEFYQYNAQKNSWDELPSMTQPREKCALVELDGYIYAIGGHLGRGDTKVERYSIANKKWEKVAPLFKSVMKPSAVAFKGKIVVFDRCHHNTGWYLFDDSGRMVELLQIYDPSSKSWHKQEIRTEHDSYDRSYGDSPPVLTVQDGLCYIVVYKDIMCASSKSKWKKAFVNRLHIGNTMTVTIANSQNQDLIPENTSGAFIINNQVFVNSEGYVHNTGVKTVEGQTRKVNVTMWDSVTSTEESVVCFTFDKLRLSSEVSSSVW